jgi:hypothetical protein
LAGELLQRRLSQGMGFTIALVPYVDNG